MTSIETTEVRVLYARRFAARLRYRNAIWRVLCRDYWQQFVSPEAAVLDLGCGYGEFINHIRAARKWAMDLNPDARDHLAADVEFLQQDCSQRWRLNDESLDVVFTSNFFEHLPTKAVLRATLLEARRCLRPGGRLIALGPNIRYLDGQYWDFWDHHLPLTERSLVEVLASCGFNAEMVLPRFLPFTMSSGLQYPVFLLRCYLRLPLLWRLFGKQFVVVARK